MLLSCQHNKKNRTSKIEPRIDKIEKSKLDNSQKIKLLNNLYNSFCNNLNDSINRNLHFLIADKFFEANEFDLYYKVVNHVKNLSLKANDSASLGRAYCYIGEFYEYTTRLDSAFSNFKKSEKIFIAIKDTVNSGRLSLYKANILYNLGVFTESEVEGIKALKLLSLTNKTRLIFEAHISIGLPLTELSDHTKALEYFELALQDLDKLEAEGSSTAEKINISRAVCYNNIGSVYQNKEMYSKALDYFYKALKTKNLKSSKIDIYAMLLDHIAYCKMKVSNINGVLYLINESYWIRDSLHSKPGLITSKIAFGEYYIFKEDTILGLKYAKDAYEMAKKIHSNYDILKALKIISENDIKNKEKFTKIYFRVDDSLQKVDRETRNKFARIAYETDRIEKENVNLLTKYKTLLLSLSILFLMFFFSIIYLRLIARNKELLYKEEQNLANETIYNLILSQQLEKENVKNQERNRIAIELHDGIVNNVFTSKFGLIALQSDDKTQKNHLISELERTEQEIRRISHDLKDNLTYADDSLQDLIIKLIDNQKNIGKTIFNLTIDKSILWQLITSENKIHIYRILQESIQNIHKYANAKNCYIFILVSSNIMTLKIWDDGLGFDITKIKKGIGLRNIQERTIQLNGNLEIISEIGVGTKIIVSFEMLKNEAKPDQFMDIEALSEDEYDL
jgi:signal transduction histidine kinase